MKIRHFPAIVFILLLTTTVSTQTSEIIIEPESKAVIGEPLIEKNGCEKFSMRINPVLPAEETKMPVVKPDPNVDYKAILVNPCADEAKLSNTAKPELNILKHKLEPKKSE